MAYIGIGDWIDLVPGALGIVIVGCAESVAAALTYARKYGYKVDADQEMIALGASNAASGLFGSAGTVLPPSTMVTRRTTPWASSSTCRSRHP